GRGVPRRDRQSLVPAPRGVRRREPVGIRGGRRLSGVTRARSGNRPRSGLVPTMTEMYELWQTEWCPASRRVRQRLTELGLDYLTRQVPVERGDRVLLHERTGSDTIPVLLAPGEEPVVGEEAILAYIDSHERVPAEARAHRLKAEKAR